MRMAFSTASNFFLIGCILFMLTADKKETSGIAHIIIIPVALASYFIPVSYILRVYPVHALGEIPVSLNTGIAFCGLCAAVLFMKPDTWLIRVFSSNDIGGIIARKLLPALIIFPVVIAWLWIKGEREGLFKSEEGVVLVALTYTVCFLAIIWLTARSASKIDKNDSHQKRRCGKVKSGSEPSLNLFRFKYQSPVSVMQR
jgi:hypothetical protein